MRLSVTTCQYTLPKENSINAIILRSGKLAAPCGKFEIEQSQAGLGSDRDKPEVSRPRIVIGYLYEYDRCQRDRILGESSLNTLPMGGVLAEQQHLLEPNNRPDQLDIALLGGI